MHVHKRENGWRPLLLALLVSWPHAASAGGYEILGHSAEGTGLNYVGALTGYQDGSAVHYNPAALAVNDHALASVGLHVVPLRYSFHDQGSSVAGEPNLGAQKETQWTTGLLPDAYLVQPLTQDLTIGVGVTSPFGLGTSYPHSWTGRYQGVEAKLHTIKSTLAGSYQVLPEWNLGAGLSAIYADATIQNAIDFGSVGASVFGPQGSSLLGLAPQRNDGLLKLTADGWGLGWQLGSLYRYGAAGRNKLALAYRAKTEISLTGDADFNVPQSAQVLTSGGAFSDTGVESDITLPEALSFGVEHWLSDSWAVLLESTWTRWSRLNRLTYEYDNPLQADSTDVLYWQNTWRHGAGLRYVASDSWEYRFGLLFDQSAVRSPAYRSPLIPLSNTYSFAAGASYQLSSAVRLHVGYSRFFYENASSARQGPTGDTLKGKWHGNSVDVLSTGVSYLF